MYDLISDLKKVSARLAKSQLDQTIALRLVDEATAHLTSGSDGYATGIELDLIALTLRAQNLLTEAEILERTGHLLVQLSRRKRSAILNAANQAGGQSNVIFYTTRRRDGNKLG
jgi:hypothetical protein